LEPCGFPKLHCRRRFDTPRVALWNWGIPLLDFQGQWEE
jgi:hypothetical protein